MPIELVLIPAAGVLTVVVGVRMMSNRQASEHQRVAHARKRAEHAGEEARERVWDVLLDDWARRR